MGLLILISALSGCSPPPPSPQTTELFRHYKEVLDNATTPKVAPKEEALVKIEPKFKELSPLHKKISISLYQEHYENILYFLAVESGLSLVLDPELKKHITPDKERLTLQLKNQPIEIILNKLCELLDISYKLDKGVLKILPYEERVFNLGFLPVLKESKSSLGGDVLGGGGGDGGAGTGGGAVNSPIKGDFTIEATLSKENLNIYEIIKNTVSIVLTEKGIFNLSPLTGTLYVKDKPSAVKAVAQIVDDYKKKYRRQIILDAQIIEIELSSGHNLGVDWFEITNLILGQNRIALDTLEFSLTTRESVPALSLTISGQPNINTLINLLKQYGELKVISNPKLRVLHSQPALISVGTSYSCIREVRVTYQQVSPGGGGVPQYEVKQSSIFDGILLGIIPFIAEEDEVYLHIVPIKSDLIDLRNLKYRDVIELSLPIVNLREMSSIVKVKPNDLIVIGGLILDKSKTQEKRVGLPLLENLTRHNIREGKNSELVILIRILVS